MPRIDRAVLDPLIREVREAEPDVSIGEIARRLRSGGVKIGEDSVRAGLIRLGFTTKRHLQVPEQNTKIAALHEAGHSDADIAATMGLTTSVVRRRITNMGLARRNIRRIPPPKPQEYHIFPGGYPRRNQNGSQEIPPNVRTLPILPSISSPEFGDDHYYYDQGLSPLVISDGGDESGKPGGGDPPSAG